MVAPLTRIRVSVQESLSSETGPIPIAITNLRPKRLRIRKGEPIAWMTICGDRREVNFVKTLREESAQETTTSMDGEDTGIWKPSEIIDVSKEMVADTRRRFLDLFDEYSDVCFKGEHDLGQTNIETHNINLISLTLTSPTTRHSELNNTLSLCQTEGRRRDDSAQHPQALKKSIRVTNCPSHKIGRHGEIFFRF